MSSKKLNIKVDNRWLDVPADVSMKIKRVNNIFYENKARRSYSMAISLPYSSRNNIALSWLFELGTPNSTVTQVDAELYDGLTFAHNVLLEVRRTNGRYQCNIQIDYGTVDVLASDVNIRNVPAFSDAANAFNGVMNAGMYPAVNYAGVYMAAYGYDFPQTIRRGLFNYQLDQTFPYLHFILKEVMNYCGWKGNSMDGSFMSDAELRQLHFVNFNTDWENGNVLPSQRLPDLTITDMLESLSLMFNASLFFENGSRSVSFELLKDLLGNTPIDWSSKVALPKDGSAFDRNWGKKLLSGITFRWSDEFYGFAKREDLSSYRDIGWQDNDTYLNTTSSDNSLVRITTENVAFAWQQPQWFPLDPAHWWYKEYLGNVSKLQDETIVGTYANKFAFPSASLHTNSLALAEDENWYYRSDGNGWRRYTYNNYEYVAGDGKRTLVSKIGVPIADRVGDGLESHNVRSLIAIKKHGPKASVADGWAENNFNDLPPMLSINRGTGVDNQGNEHYVGNPNQDRGTDFSSPEIFNTQGTQVGNYRLTWGTDNGLFNTFHKPWFDYVSNGQEVTFMANLTLRDIVNLDLKRPIHVHGAVGFIREMEYELPLTKPVKVTFVKKA